MKKLMLEMMKEGGKDINDILDMPFAFFMELVDESNKKNVKKTQYDRRVHVIHLISKEVE